MRREYLTLRTLRMALPRGEPPAAGAGGALVAARPNARAARQVALGAGASVCVVPGYCPCL